MAAKSKRKRGRAGSNGWGGRRRGAGRPTDELRAELRAAQANLAGQILLAVDRDPEGEIKAWEKFLHSKDPNVAMRARIYLSDMRTPPPKPGDIASHGSVTLHFNCKRPKWLPEEPVK